MSAIIILVAVKLFGDAGEVYDFPEEQLYVWTSCFSLTVFTRNPSKKRWVQQSPRTTAQFENYHLASIFPNENRIFHMNIEWL